MSTNDVPGYRDENNDELRHGCWAEHEDGSLIFVESTEANRVIYSVFDMSREPPMEYRDAMPEASFKTTFSWKGGDDEKWTWHDKTPFPWDRIIEIGVEDGPRYPSAHHIATAAERIQRNRERHRATAAERVAKRLRLHGEEMDRDAHTHRQDRQESAMMGILTKIHAAVEKMTGSASASRRKNKSGGRAARK
jgi:hypothetical protein